MRVLLLAIQVAIAFATPKYHNDHLSQPPKHGNDDIARLRQEVDDLTNEFVQQQEDFSMYQENTQSLLEGLNKKLSNQVDTVKGLTRRVKNQGNEIVELQKADNASLVAFTAYTYNARPVLDEQPIIFEYTVSNIGNHYNPLTGRFQCPITGLYLFTVNIVTMQDEGAEVHIVIEGDTLVSCYADDYRTETGVDLNLQSGNAVLVKCEEDESVWVRSDREGFIDMVSRSTTFSGVMLKRMDE